MTLSTSAPGSFDVEGIPEGTDQASGRKWKREQAPEALGLVKGNRVSGGKKEAGQIASSSVNHLSHGDLNEAV